MGRHTRGEKAAAYHHRGLPNNIVCQLLELLRPSAETCPAAGTLATSVRLPLSPSPSVSSLRASSSQWPGHGERRRNLNVGRWPQKKDGRSWVEYTLLKCACVCACAWQCANL